MNKFLVCIASIGILLFQSASLEAKKKKQYFEVTSFKVDFDITHPVMSGNFLGNQEREILLRGDRIVDDHKQPIFVLYTKNIENKGYSKHSEFIVPKSTISFDLITNVKGIEEILLLSSENLSRFNFLNNQAFPVTDVQSIYKEINPTFSSNRKLVMDINGDKLDDIFVSDFYSMSVFLQQIDGEFEKVTIPINARSDRNSSEVAYSETPFYLVDTNFDSLIDIVIVKESELVTFEQLISGSFSSISNSIKLPFDASGVPWWLARRSDGSLKDQSDLTHNMIEKIEDINGDKNPDLFIRATKSSGVLDKQIQYHVYFGMKNGGQLEYSKLPSTKIKSEGTLSNLQLIDTNNDSIKEVLVSFFDIGVSQIVGALLSGSIDQDVFVYSLNEQGEFEDDPNFEGEVELNFSLSSGSEGQPIVLSADFQGSGNKSLVLSGSEKSLSIFEQEDSVDLFKSRSKRHRITLPKKGSMATVADLNNDKKDEIILRYGKQDDEGLQRTITLLSPKLSY